MSFEIVNVTQDHVSDLQDLYQYYVLNSISTFRCENDADVDFGFVLRRSQIDLTPFLVAVQGDKVLGFAYVSSYNGSLSGYRYTAYDTIYLHPDYLGLGIGSVLLKTLISKTKLKTNLRHLISQIALQKDQITNPSIALHEKFGFKKVGRMFEVGHKFNQSLDVVMMQLQLT